MSKPTPLIVHTAAAIIGPIVPPMTLSGNIEQEQKYRQRQGSVGENLARGGRLHHANTESAP